MQHQIYGSTMQVVDLELNPGEVVFSESGAMSWMTPNINMNTNMGNKGFLGALGRTMAGESLFVVDYTPMGGPGRVAFAASAPGKIIPMQLAAGQAIVAQKDAFLCAEKSVDLAIHFKKKLGVGFFGGEGFIMERLTGPGMAFFEIDGEVIEYELQRGQTLKVDTGYVAMYEPTVTMDIEMLRGFTNVLFGGEGLFLTTVTGPGRVWLQTMPIKGLAQKLIPFIPTGQHKR